MLLILSVDYIKKVSEIKPTKPMKSCLRRRTVTVATKQ